VEGCVNPLSPMSRAGTKCRSCKNAEFQALRTAKRDQRALVLRKQGAVLIHSCLAGEFDPFNVTRCKCKLLGTKEEVTDLFKQYLVRNLAPDSRHADHWDGRSDVFLLNSNQTPRVPTLENAHILRGVEKAWSHRGKSQAQLEAEHQDLQRRIAEDKLERFEEERLRWEVWAELQDEWTRSITVEIPEDKWIADEKAARGDLACRTILSIDERTSAGTDYDRSSSREQIEDQDDQTATTTKTESAEDLQSLTFDDDPIIDKEINYQSLEDLSEDMAEAA